MVECKPLPQSADENQKRYGQAPRGVGAQVEIKRNTRKQFITSSLQALQAVAFNRVENMCRRAVYHNSVSSGVTSCFQHGLQRAPPRRGAFDEAQVEVIVIEHL